MTLEGLLNKLIEKGWKVYGEYDKLMTFGQNWGRKVFGFGELGEVEYSLRELVSKESGLWQFVCKNKLYPKNRGHKRENDLGNGEMYYEDERQYYVIESALCDEDKLEQFLLYKIKIDG